jgi:hypothetical protein
MMNKINRIVAPTTAMMRADIVLKEEPGRDKKRKRKRKKKSRRRGLSQRC